MNSSVSEVIEVIVIWPVCIPHAGCVCVLARACNLCGRRKSLCSIQSSGRWGLGLRCCVDSPRCDSVCQHRLPLVLFTAAGYISSCGYMDRWSQITVWGLGRVECCSARVVFSSGPHVSRLLQRPAWGWWYCLLVGKWPRRSVYPTAVLSTTIIFLSINLTIIFLNEFRSFNKDSSTIVKHLKQIPYSHMAVVVNRKYKSVAVFNTRVPMHQFLDALQCYTWWITINKCSKVDYFPR